MRWNKGKISKRSEILEELGFIKKSSGYELSNTQGNAWITIFSDGSIDDARRHDESLNDVWQELLDRKCIVYESAKERQKDLDLLDEAIDNWVDECKAEAMIEEGWNLVGSTDEKYIQTWNRVREQKI